jgi:hypothetical protein
MRYLVNDIFFCAVYLSLLLEKCSQTNSILAEQPNFFFFPVFNIEVEYPNKLNTLIMSQRSLSRSQSEIVRTEQTDFAGQYDYVFVFKMVKSYNNSGVFEQSDCAKKCIFSMLEAGLEVFPYLSIQQDELLVLVKCSVRSSIYHLI